MYLEVTMRHALLVAMRERGDELLKERPREFLGELLGEDRKKEVDHSV